MEKLEEFGLTKYEIKVYLFLLRSGTNDARKLSTETEVPFGRIYDVLYSLEGKGLITSQNSRPKMFMAIDPKLVVKSLLKNKTQEYNHLINTAGELEEELSKISSIKSDKSLFWNVTIGKEAVDTYTKTLTEAQEELLTYIETHPSGQKSKNKRMWIDGYLQTISKIVKFGVQIKLLIGYHNIEEVDQILDFGKPYLSSLKEIQIKSIPVISNPFDVIDNEKVLLKVKNPANPADHFASIYIWQRQFAKELKEKFLEIWSEAKEFSPDIENIKEED